MDKFEFEVIIVKMDIIISDLEKNIKNLKEN